MRIKMSTKFTDSLERGKTLIELNSIDHSIEASLKRLENLAGKKSRIKTNDNTKNDTLINVTDINKSIKPNKSKNKPKSHNNTGAKQ